MRTSAKQRNWLPDGLYVNERGSILQELQMNEDRYRLLFQQSIDAIYVYELETRQVIDANKAFLDLLGYTLDEAKNLTVYDIVARDSSVVDKNLRRFADSGKFPPVNGAWRKHDGSVVHVDVSISKFEQYGKTVCYTVGRDVTEKEIAQEKLRDSEEQFRTLAEKSPNMIFIIKHGRIIFSNELSTDILGYSKEEFCSADFDMFKLVTPPYRKTAEESLRKQLSGNEASPSRHYELVTKDGKKFQVIVTSKLVKLGNENAILAIITDITNLKQTEEQLKKQTEQIHLLYETNRKLNLTLDLNEIYGTMYDFVLSAMDCFALYVSSFEPDGNMIKCAAAWSDGKRLSPQNFPAIPLEPEGQGTQSKVIRSGEPLLLNDYASEVKSASSSYHVDESGNMVNEIPPDAPHVRSALIVPLKVSGKVTGVIQVFSYKEDAYTKEHLELLESMSLHASSAINNAVLFGKATAELEERKKAEERIKESLNEKEILLREVHHRVKNNLQVISSLLHLQSGFVKDPEAKIHFIESQNRIKSMALIHQSLYRSSNLSRINFGDYLEQLSRHLLTVFGISQSRVALELCVDELDFNFDTSVACGLLINELMSNSLKHAFPDYRKGRIKLALSKQGEKYLLDYEDDGVGVAENIDMNKADTLGFQLIDAMVSQLDGSMEMHRDNGIRYKITFGAMKYAKRT